MLSDLNGNGLSPELELRPFPINTKHFRPSIASRDTFKLMMRSQSLKLRYLPSRFWLRLVSLSSRKVHLIIFVPYADIFLDVNKLFLIRQLLKCPFEINLIKMLDGKLHIIYFYQPSTSVKVASVKHLSAFFLGKPARKVKFDLLSPSLYGYAI